MLRELRINNFGIIEDQSISFGEGLNVISGETGSGKSTVLQALEMILGGRPKAHQIRSGSDGWKIEALFSLEGFDCASLPEIARSEELSVSRSLATSGRGKILINGSLSTSAVLAEVVSRLLNICGQGHENRLLDSAYHLVLIDEYAGNREILLSYQTAFNRVKQLEQELSLMVERKQNASRRRAELEFVIEELTALNLRIGMREELEASVKRLSNAESLILKARELIEVLSGDDGLVGKASSVVTEVFALQRIDRTLHPITDLFRSAEVNLDEGTRELSRYASSLQLNQGELDALRDKLAEIARVERKYGTDESGLLKILEDARGETEDLGSRQNEADLRKDLEMVRSNLDSLGAKLGRLRISAARKLTTEVQRDLADLNMAGARLEVAVQSCEARMSGCEKAEFLFAPGRGEPLKALSQIASGGELSRIMLVLKKVLKERSGVNVLVFDEVDSGISGAVARAVGEKLRELSRNSQVLCITHLAQVASLADHHFKIDKIEGERTLSVIREISGPEKVDEIARMLAGYVVTKAARSSARELLSSKS